MSRARMADSPGRERGVALVVAMVILLVLTVIGVTAIMTTSMEGRLAGGMQELNRAYQAAETGIDTFFRKVELGTSTLPLTTTDSAAVDPAKESPPGAYPWSYDLRITYRGATNISGASRCDSESDPVAGRINQRSRVSSANVGRLYQFQIESKGQASLNAEANVTRGMCRLGTL